MRPALQQNIAKMTFVIAGLFSTFLTPQGAMAVDILDDPIQIDERLTQLISPLKMITDSWTLVIRGTGDYARYSSV